jgi:hypothetical protein
MLKGLLCFTPPFPGFIPYPLQVQSFGQKITAFIIDIIFMAP